MAEPSLDARILEVLSSARQAVANELADEARQLAEQNCADKRELSIEALLGAEVLELSGLMSVAEKRRKDFETQRALKSSRKLIQNHPNLKLSRGQATALVRHAAKIPPNADSRFLVSPEFGHVQPEGLSGEQVTQAWRVALRVGPRPAQHEVAAEANIQIQCVIGSTAVSGTEAVPLYEISATKYKSGNVDAEAREDDQQLRGAELYAPLGFVLAAQKQYK